MMTQYHLEKFDEGEKLGALEATLVEIVWGAVRCRHDDHAVRKQRREQPSQNHGVHNVGDLDMSSRQKKKKNR